MLWPKRINPDPIVIANVELRLVEPMDIKLALSGFMLSIAEILPNYQRRNILFEIQNQQSPLFEYALSDDNYKFSFSESTLLIELTGDYPLWENYKLFVSIILDRIIKLDIVKSGLARVGLRYGSVLNSNEVKILKRDPEFIEFGSFSQWSQFKVNIREGDFDIFLQIINNTKVKTITKDRTGLYIDIDVALNSEITFDNNILNLLEKMHYVEKKLFFELLDKKYLDKLKLD